MERKTLDEIGKREYAMFHWQDVTVMGDARRMFVKGFERTPEEMVQAAKDYDEWYLRRCCGY
jgi:hypothetical protein